MHGISLTFRDRKCRAPLVTENVQTDAAIRVDVGVVDAGGEVDLRWFERIIGGKVDRQEEHPARIRTITLLAAVSPITMEVKPILELES